MGVAYRLGVHPQVVVMVVAFGLAMLGVRDLVGAALYLWWHDSYRQVDLVMTEASPNDGTPIIRGRLEPGNEDAVLEATWRDDTFRAIADPSIVFAPGRRVRVWWSASAPIVGLGPGRSTQYMPVSTLPSLPGYGRLAWGLARVAMPLVVGVVLLPILARLGIRSRWYQAEHLLDGEGSAAEEGKGPRAAD